MTNLPSLEVRFLAQDLQLDKSTRCSRSRRTAEGGPQHHHNAIRSMLQSTLLLLLPPSTTSHHRVVWNPISYNGPHESRCTTTRLLATTELHSIKKKDRLDSRDLHQAAAARRCLLIERARCCDDGRTEPRSDDWYEEIERFRTRSRSD